MIVLVDATCARMGGIATYADNLLSRWRQEFPDDDIHVAVPTGSGQVYDGCVMHYVRVPRPAALWRPIMTTLSLRRLTRELRPDAVLATLPSTSLRRLGAPTLVVVHDLRHEIRPEQFARWRRVLRSVSYTRGYQIADGFIAVSHQTRADLLRLHPSVGQKPVAVVYHGADHVDSWFRGPQRDEPVALAFGHHTNKNLEVVLAAWRAMLHEEGAAPRLSVVGIDASTRASIAAEIDAAGLTDLVHLHPYLPSHEFEALMSAANVVVFPSEAEGFGLPVLESMRLGIPVVVGPDPAVLEISGGHAHQMRSFTAAALVEGIRHALNASPEVVAAASAHANCYVWAESVFSTRQALVDLAESGRASRS